MYTCNAERSNDFLPSLVTFPLLQTTHILFTQMHFICSKYLYVYKIYYCTVSTCYINFYTTVLWCVRHFEVLSLSQKTSDLIKSIQPM